MADRFGEAVTVNTVVLAAALALAVAGCDRKPTAQSPSPGTSPPSPPVAATLPAATAPVRRPAVRPPSTAPREDPSVTERHARAEALRQAKAGRRNSLHPILDALIRVRADDRAGVAVETLQQHISDAQVEFDKWSVGATAEAKEAGYAKAIDESLRNFTTGANAWAAEAKTRAEIDQGKYRDNPRMTVNLYDWIDADRKRHYRCLEEGGKQLETAIRLLQEEGAEDAK